MTIPQQANTYTVATGTRPSSSPVVVTRAPTSYDINYPVGQIWIDKSANNQYILTSFSSSGGVMLANWEAGASASALDTLTGDSGGAISPTSGNINLLGTVNQITTTGAGSTITWSLPATMIAPGSLEVTGLLTGDASATINTAGTALNLATDNDTATVNLGNGTSARTINIGSTAGVKTINIGSGAAANVLTIGSTTASASLSLQSGSGGNTSIAGNAAATITIGAAAQTGAISVGTSTATNALNLGTGNGNKTINLGTGTGTNAIHLADGAGTNTITMGNGASVNTITIGSTNTTSATTIQAGSGGINLTGDVNLTAVATKISLNGGAVTDFIGQAVLVNGTVTVANTNIAATDRIFVTRSAKNASTAYGTFEVVITPATNFVITSCKSDTTTETNDASTVDYIIFRQT